MLGIGFDIHRLAPAKGGFASGGKGERHSTNPDGFSEREPGTGKGAMALRRHWPLVIGGVRLDYPKGLLGHSDADVLLHALIDALLGAAKAGDIGDLFPDTDPAYKNISSAVLLREALKIVRAKIGRRPVKEVDSIIFAEAPKLGKRKSVIGRNIARLLGISPKQVNVKAKTMEGLGPIGGKNAIAALVLISI